MPQKNIPINPASRYAFLLLSLTYPIIKFSFEIKILPPMRAAVKFDYVYTVT